MVRRKCIVRICQNKTDNEKKIFIHVPRKSDVQKNWRKVLNLPASFSFYGSQVICEDHFDLEKDAQNWVQYKLMSNRLILKPEVIPHKYIDSPPPSDLPSTLTDSERKRKIDFIEENFPNDTRKVFTRKVCAKKTLHKDLSDIKIPTKELILPSPVELLQTYNSSERFICPVGVQVHYLGEVANLPTNIENTALDAQNILIEVPCSLLEEMDEKPNVAASSSSINNVRVKKLMIYMKAKISRTQLMLFLETYTEDIEMKQECEEKDEGDEPSDSVTEVTTYEDVPQSMGDEASTIDQVHIKEEISSDHDEHDYCSAPKRIRHNDVPSSSAFEDAINAIDDEYDTFSKDIAAQLRDLPRINFFILREKIQELISNEKENLASDGREINNWIKIEKE